MKALVENEALAGTLLAILLGGSTAIFASYHKSDTPSYSSELVKPTPNKSYTSNLIVKQDLSSFRYVNAFNCLVQAVYFEDGSSNATPHSRKVVIDSVLNRLEHSNWPSSVCNVIYQSKQYSFAEDNLKYDPSNSLQKAEREEIKKQVGFIYSAYLNNEYTPEKIYYYYNPDKVSKTPNWVDEKYYVGTYGEHKAYRWHKNAS